MKTLLGAALALMFGVMIVSAPVSASAQRSGNDTAEIAKDWSLRIGIFVFNNQASRNKSGEVGISGLAERTVYKSETYDIAVGMGYNGFGDEYSVPITVTGIVHNANLRMGAALGYAFGKRLDGEGTSGALMGLLLGY